MELYSYVPPTGDDIPISVEPFPVNDSVPTEEDIKWAVTQLQNHISRGLSGMRAELLKGWLSEVSKKEREEEETEQATMVEGTTEVNNRTGGRGRRK